MYKAYAGIGSRDTPKEVCEQMTNIAQVLDGMGWTLRSGGATGADTAFADGASFAQYEEYIPWHKFSPERIGVEPIKLNQTNEIYDLAAHYWDKYPKEMSDYVRCDWVNLKDTTKLMMMRNVHQILGLDLHTPSRAVICWTPNGAMKGGTSFAMWIAMWHSIPIFNLANADAYERMETFFDPDYWKDC
ncbi:hypothetical protein PP749_gp024 [Rhizobium phage RHEph22]|uniref:Uncharacterized protein n=1 Tax=Rhizobium phage RHEph22 TaxID=2836135 RepID=A0AAE7VMW0_9CAUD|nr:hypothetical protein PP749_gp024 [Rhizobium phage RHEph22]QXV74697.1 hypothetical protein [Rhizobium phage RHEph22]QXV74792.1 hypothetical protein [Rhizobium phage RHEph24]